jgi:hypothetical protein
LRFEKNLKNLDMTKARAGPRLFSIQFTRQPETSQEIFQWDPQPLFSFHILEIHGYSVSEGAVCLTDDVTGLGISAPDNPRMRKQCDRQ